MRNKRLGSIPSIHQDEERWRLTATRRLVSAARKSLARGDCKSALDEATTAAFEAGAYHAHQSSYGSGKRSWAVKAGVRTLLGRVVAKCGKKKR